MDYQEINYHTLPSREQQLEASAAFPALMRKVYLWMAMALVITGFTSYAVATSPVLANLIFSNRAVVWVLFGAELLLVMAISAGINRLSLSVATLLFVVYSVVNGATMATIYYAFTMQSIATVFFITAGTFGAMSLYGFTTKSDLSTWGKWLIMALVGIIIASIVNIFMHSSALDAMLSYVGVLIFVGLTAYDTQKIKQMFLQVQDTGETAQKLALIGALSLYLDFINLFLYLLRIFGRRD